MSAVQEVVTEAPAVEAVPYFEPEPEPEVEPEPVEV